MKRFSFLLPVLALALLLPAATIRAENPEWNNLLKEFKKTFKTKAPLKERRQAIKSLSRSSDGRAVKEILKVIKSQDKHAEKLRKEYDSEEEAWNEKTDRLQEQVDRKVEQANGGQFSVTQEESEWLGLLEQHRQNPKMMVEKVQDPEPLQERPGGRGFLALHLQADRAPPERPRGRGAGQGRQDGRFRLEAGEVRPGALLHPHVLVRAR